MPDISSRLRSLLALAVVLLLAAAPLTGCDSADPSTPDGNQGDQNEEEENQEENEEEENQGEVGGSFSVTVVPTTAILGGLDTEVEGSAIFYVDEDSGRFVIALTDDAVLSEAFPFEFIVFSTPEGRPDPGTYPLSLNFEQGFMGGYVELRGTDLVDIEFPVSNDVYQLPPSAILQSFTGELVVTASNADRIEGTLRFDGIPIDTERPPFFVLGQSEATGSFEAIEATGAEIPDLDLELYLPEEFELP